MLVKSCDRSYGKSHLECGVLFTVKQAYTLVKSLYGAIYETTNFRLSVLFLYCVTNYVLYIWKNCYSIEVSECVILN